MKIYLFCILVAACVFGCMAQSATFGTVGAVADFENATEQVGNIEEQTLRFFLDHHYVGIRAATQCLITPDISFFVQGLCRQINAVERASFEILRDLLERLYGVEYTPPVLDITGATATAAEAASAGAQELSQSLMFWQEQLSNLSESTGQEFEMKLLRFLIVYEGAGIAGAIPCAQSALHKELTDFCINEIQNLAAQIGQVRAFFCGKYEMCQIELTPEEISVPLNAYNDVSLGLGTVSFTGGTAGTGETAAQTNIATVTEIGTVTELATSQG